MQKQKWMVQKEKENWKGEFRGLTELMGTTVKRSEGAYAMTTTIIQRQKPGKCHLPEW